MPAMTDPYFAKSVTFICYHNQEGAMGIVINRPIDMTLDALFEQVDLRLDATPLAAKPASFGGRVQLARGFVLHQPAGNWQAPRSEESRVGKECVGTGRYRCAPKHSK